MTTFKPFLRKVGNSNAIIFLLSKSRTMPFAAAVSSFPLTVRAGTMKTMTALKFFLQRGMNAVVVTSTF